MTHWLFLLSLVFTQDEFFIIKLACALFCHSQFGFARLSEWIFVRFSGVKRVSKLGKFIQGWPSLLDPKVWTGVFDTQKTATQGISKGPFNQIVRRQTQITSLRSPSVSKILGAFELELFEIRKIEVVIAWKYG